MNCRLFDFIRACPTAYHTVAESERQLLAAGFLPMPEEEPFRVTPGGRYYVTRNGSSLIAFRIPSGGFSGFMIAAAHGDSPSFKLRERPTLAGKDYLRLSTEKYGGMILSTWMDRPLSVAGRVTVREGSGFSVRCVDLGDPFLIIPNVAIHMTRTAGENGALDPAVDLVPLAGTGAAPSLEKRLSDAVSVAPEEILSSELFLYNPEPGVCLGDLIAAPRLDDLQAVFGALTAFLEAGEPQSAMPVLAILDNEEVGSTTKQGAASTFLADTLQRVLAALGKDGMEYRRMLACSLLVSCDNAHARHPNHPEYADKIDAPLLNGGIVIKQNAAQRYTTDAVSAALFRLICERAGVPTQSYSNRPSIPGGSTLGNIANTQVSLNSVDIGLAQLAMHSAMETAGARDTEYLVRALTVLFSCGITRTEAGYGIV